MTTTANNNVPIKNPWKGLRTYSEGETIYGRSNEIQMLSLLILQSHQTVVYGRSGIGKSSIMNAGIFPLLREKGLFPVSIRFEHNVKTTYLQQIKNAIKREIGRNDQVITAIEVVSESGLETLWEFFHRTEYQDSEGNVLKPLIFFDQFEEIFTLENDKDKVSSFFSELADLINNVMPDSLLDGKNSDQGNGKEPASESIGLDLGLDLVDDMTYSYYINQEYHLVFTIREDYLSYLERNTTDIPELRNNRFCLQPINGEQAMEIIMSPRPGLIPEDVAVCIIQKVTGQIGISRKDLCRIEVDSAMLSLYLSGLYDKMISLGEVVFTKQLVDNYSDNIKEDFYLRSVEGLPEESIEWIEGTLVNVDGVRDNRDISTVLKESGLRRDQLDDLILEKKLLRQFSYGGVLRIELIHDVLCDVIVGRRQKREEAAAIAELKKHSIKEKKRFAMKVVAIAVAIVILVVAGALLFVKGKTDVVQVVKPNQNVVISFVEDHTVGDVDFWKATLSVIGTYKNQKDSLLLSCELDKSDLAKTFTISADSCVKLHFRLDFGDFVDIGKYVNQELDIPVSELMESPTVKIPVVRNLPDMSPYLGRIVLDIGKSGIPIEDAVVMIGDVMTKTDSVGNFQLFFEEMPGDKDRMLIAKSGFGALDIAVKPLNAEGVVDYKVFPVDSLRPFYEKCEKLDTITQWDYSTVGRAYCTNKGSENGLYVKYNNGESHRLRLYLENDDVVKDKVNLKGYFYFDDLLGADSEKRHDKYYIASGYIDRYRKEDENGACYRNFEIRGYDIASNLRIIRGRYYSNKRYSGEIVSGRASIATFGRAVN